MNPNFFNPHNLGGDYLDLENDLRLGTPTAVFGVSEAQKALKEFLGHTPLEVLGGAVLGIALGFLIPIA